MRIGYSFPYILRGGFFFALVSVIPIQTLAATKAVLATDPGVRSNAGAISDSAKICPSTDAIALSELTDPKYAPQKVLFCKGADEFAKENTVLGDGLGPTFNLTSCIGCHLHPTIGGSSPPGHNPQFDFVQNNSKNGFNKLPWFITEDGPVKIARFVKDRKSKTKDPDGGVHALFTISGLKDAEGCTLHQPDFEAERKHKNVIFRIPTPVFGGGLIEAIEDQTIHDNLDRNHREYGKKHGVPRGKVNIVRNGHTKGNENRNGNDGTIARFGWKAQNKSLLVFAGEAYNVEMGISNELFQTERDETPECQPTDVSVPNDTTHPENLNADNVEDRYEALSDIEKFAAFMRFLAPPARTTPAGVSEQSVAEGEQIFERIGCAACHTPTMRTSKKAALGLLRDKEVPLYSDLALHDMGDGLQDGIHQGQAKEREFRTAPLWGVGQRAYFLHDGRARNLIDAIKEHKSNGSAANGVIKRYNHLKEEERQSLLNFLRSL